MSETGFLKNCLQQLPEQTNAGQLKQADIYLAACFATGAGAAAGATGACTGRG